MARARRASAASTSRPRKPAGQRAPVEDIPPLEWAAATVGLALAATAIGLTAWDALFGVRGPPAIEVRLKDVTVTAHGYVARIEAFNHGGEPAAQVQVEGALEGGARPESASATFDYIPEGSHVSGGLVFEQDPRAGDLRLRAKGFVDAS